MKRRFHTHTQHTYRDTHYILIQRYFCYITVRGGSGGGGVPGAELPEVVTSAVSSQAKKVWARRSVTPRQLFQVRGRGEVVVYFIS